MINRSSSHVYHISPIHLRNLRVEVSGGRRRRRERDNAYEGKEEVQGWTYEQRVERYDQLKEYMNLLSKDKKNIDDSIVCILPEGDKIKVKKITNKDKIKKYISEYFKIAVEEK